MDKVIKFVRDGKGKLPPGFRFQPTDEEIVFQYLARKVFSHPLPSSVIPEISIFSFDPWNLPGDAEQDKYFFSNTGAKDIRHVNQISGATCGGQWKVVGSDEQIICRKKLPLVGIKRTMAFYNGSCRTDWIMHVYCITTSENSNSNSQHKKNPKGPLVQIGSWIMCHVMEESREDEAGGNGGIRNDDTYMLNDADSCSASSTSCYNYDYSALTEVSSGMATGETSSQNF